MQQNQILRALSDAASLSSTTASNTPPSSPSTPAGSTPALLLGRPQFPLQIAETLAVSPLQLSPVEPPSPSLAPIELWSEQWLQSSHDIALSGNPAPSTPSTPFTPSRPSSSSSTSSPSAQFTPSNDRSRIESQDMVTATIEATNKLLAYHIYAPTDAAVPVELQAHIDQTVMAPRDPSSPAAARLYRDQPIASIVNERSAINLLAGNLLFRPEVDDGERYIFRADEVYLSNEYLPDAPTTLVRNSYGNLSMPVADSAIGYILARHAIRWGVASPFQIAEEIVLAGAITPVTVSIRFPFLTCEWKSPVANEGHAQATNQGARSGTAIVNYNHAFLEKAGFTPSVVETCHFSITCDMETAWLWIHWRMSVAGTVGHHMKKIGQYFVRDLHDPTNASMIQMRCQLRNILDWAVGPRLSIFKTAIANIAEKEEDTLAGPKSKRKRT